MSMQSKVKLSLGLLLAGALLVTALVSPRLQADDAPEFLPAVVEKDMHEFMEYVFQPSFLRLKAAMAQPATTDSQWKAIKGEALTLAECCNLLLMRVPLEQTDLWGGTSAQVRRYGSALYHAADEKNWADARDAYGAMINNCNLCHQHFADGEHQLRP